MGPMRLATLLGPDLQALKADPEALREAFEEFHVEDVAELLEDLPEREVLELLDALPSELGADVIERLSPERQVVVLRGLEPESALELITEMDPDDRADFFEELDDDEQKKLLSELAKTEPEAAEQTQELLAWDAETAGGLMTPEYIGLAPDTKVWEAIEYVRRQATQDEAETIYYIYVVYSETLVGVVSLRDLILAGPGQTLDSVMTEKVVTVRPETDQEEVARLIARYDLTALPVVSSHGEMLGVVTIDDLVDVVIEEATEDAHKQGGVVPLEDSYFSTGLV